MSGKITGKIKIRSLLPRIVQNLGFGEKGLDLIKNIGCAAKDNGFNAFIVGGFARDAIIYGIQEASGKGSGPFRNTQLFKHSNLDIDITVEGNAIEFTRILSKIGPPVFNILELKNHKNFATSSVLFSINGKKAKIDFTSARSESYSKPGALPTVELSGKNIKRDVFRRDFTVNATALSLVPEEFLSVKDFVGGLEDILGRKIRILHDLSFNDDPTRIFRAVRFEKRLGFRMEKKTRFLLKQALADKVMDRISGKRITSELGIIFREKSPWSYMARLEKLGILAAVYPSLTFDREKMRVFKRISSGEKLVSAYIEGFSDNFIFFMAELLSGLNKKDFENSTARLGIDARLKNKLALIYKEAETLESIYLRMKGENSLLCGKRISNSGIFNLFKKINPYGLVFYIFKCKINNRRLKEHMVFRNYLVKYIKRIEPVKPVLTGNDLKAAGICEGVSCGIVLNELRLLKMDGKLRTRKDELLYVEKKIKG